MNGALTAKMTRDSAVVVLMTSVALVLFGFLFVLAMSNWAQDLLLLWSKIGFIQRMFRFVLSIDLQGEVTVNTLIVSGFVHPFLLMITWGCVVSICTHFIVEPIDRGTADLLFTLPISRATYFVSATAVWVSASGVIACAALLGIWIGGEWFDLTPPLPIFRLILVVMNLWILYFAIGCLAMCVAALVNRRTQAVGGMVALLLSSFLINVLEAFIPFLASKFLISTAARVEQAIIQVGQSLWPNWTRRLTTNQKIGGSSPSRDCHHFVCIYFYPPAPP